MEGILILLAIVAYVVIRGLIIGAGKNAVYAASEKVADAYRKSKGETEPRHSAAHSLSDQYADMNQSSDADSAKGDTHE